MINFHKTPAISNVQVSPKRSSRKDTRQQLKKKLTKSNKEYLKLIGLIK